MRNNPVHFTDVKGVATSKQIGVVLKNLGFERFDSETEVIYRENFKKTSKNPHGMRKTISMVYKFGFYHPRVGINPDPRERQPANTIVSTI
jgi:hypothetical protein